MFLFRTSKIWVTLYLQIRKVHIYKTGGTCKNYMRAPRSTKTIRRGQVRIALGLLDARLPPHPNFNLDYSFQFLQYFQFCNFPFVLVLFSTVQCCSALYSTVQYCPVLFSAAQYYPVLCSIAQYCTVLLSPVQYCSVLCSTVQCSTVHYCLALFSTVQYCSVPSSTVQYCSVLYSTVQYSSVLFSTVAVTQRLSRTVLWVEAVAPLERCSRAEIVVPMFRVCHRRR